MDSTRQQKIARLIQKDMGSIFQQKAKDWFSGALITTTIVRVTKDLSIARVYVSIYAINGMKSEEILAQIKTKTSELRNELGIRVKNQLRIIPHLEFFIDDSLDYLENIERLLKS